MNGTINHDITEHNAQPDEMAVYLMKESRSCTVTSSDQRIMQRIRYQNGGRSNCHNTDEVQGNITVSQSSKETVVWCAGACCGANRLEENETECADCRCQIEGDGISNHIVDAEIFFSFRIFLDSKAVCEKCHWSFRPLIFQYLHCVLSCESFP